MLKILNNDALRVGYWVMNILGGIYTKKDSWAIGLEKDGEIAAGFVYNNYIPNRCINIHSAGHIWTKEFIKAGFNYAFITKKCEQTIHYIDSTNIKSIDITSRLGAEYQGLIPKASTKGDLLIYTMQKQDFKFKDR